MSSKAIAIAVVAACAVIAALAGVFLINREGGEQVWWVFSDPHVFPGGEERYLRTAVEDVNKLGIADYAICLGDLANNSDRCFEPIAAIMENLKVKRWYHVLGNHDFDHDTGEPILPLSYRGIDVAGIRFVMISSEKGWENGANYAGGYMGEEQFDWLWGELITYRNRPVFLFSHQPYYQWNVWPKLETALKDGAMHVDVWFHGHLHQWTITENTPAGFMSFGVNSLDWNNQYESIFLFIRPRGGEVEVEIKARNHLQGVWLDEPYYKLTFKSSRPQTSGMGLSSAATTSSFVVAISSFFGACGRLQNIYMMVNFPFLGGKL